MAEEKQEKKNTTLSSGLTAGGSTAPVSGVSGMSPAERAQYIQELQRSSPLSRISQTIKNVGYEGFGLVKSIFAEKNAWLQAVSKTYQKLSKSGGINQPIPGLTEKVRGQERLKHEMPPAENVSLPDGLTLDRSKGLFVDSKWTPRPKGDVK